MDKYGLIALVLAIPFWQFGLFFIMFPKKARLLIHRMLRKKKGSSAPAGDLNRMRMTGIFLCLAGCLVAAAFYFVMR